MAEKKERPPQKHVPGYKSENQKYKSLLVMQYILKHADDEHAVTVSQIMDHLAMYGIDAERRSIYRDIQAMNDLLSVERDKDNGIADRDQLKYEISFTRRKMPNAETGGYLVTSRPYKFDDLQLLAECVNAARFLSENQAKNLRHTISDLCSEHQAKQLNKDSTVVNRAKTINKSVIKSVATINQAIRHGHKIEFRYLSYSFDNMRTQVERRSGKPYVVDPYKLLIDNGFYYLMAYNGKKVINWRIDRMNNVRELSVPREWEKEFKTNINLEDYTRRVFSMFTGERERVTIRFRIERLDTVVDQFGIHGVKYERVDDTHFTAQAEVELSDMFYAWVFGFGRRAKIIDPPYVAQKMHEYCNKIGAMYEPKESDGSD